MSLPRARDNSQRTEPPKSLILVHCLVFVGHIYQYILPYAIVDNPYCLWCFFINSVKKNSVFFWDLGQWNILFPVHWQFYLLLKAKQTFSKAILWPPQKDLGAFEQGLLAQFVFPPLSHMTWCILWKQTCCLWFYFRKFSAIRVCVCLHDGVWRLIRFLPPSYLARAAQQAE